MCVVRSVSDSTLSDQCQSSAPRLERAAAAAGDCFALSDHGQGICGR